MSSPLLVSRMPVIFLHNASVAFCAGVSFAGALGAASTFFAAVFFAALATFAGVVLEAGFLVAFTATFFADADFAGAFLLGFAGAAFVVRLAAAGFLALARVVMAATPEC